MKNSVTLHIVRKDDHFNVVTGPLKVKEVLSKYRSDPSVILIKKVDVQDFLKSGEVLYINNKR